MNVARLTPVFLSFILLAAHFLRASQIPLVSICLLPPVLLFIRKAWVVRVVQAALVLGGVEWVRTLAALSSRRQMVGEPWVRMAVILGAVALVTFLAVLVFRSQGLRKRYSL